MISFESHLIHNIILFDVNACFTAVGLASRGLDHDLVRTLLIYVTNFTSSWLIVNVISDSQIEILFIRFFSVKWCGIKTSNLVLYPAFPKYFITDLWSIFNFFAIWWLLICQASFISVNMSSMFSMTGHPERNSSLISNFLDNPILYYSHRYRIISINFTNFSCSLCYILVLIVIKFWKISNFFFWCCHSYLRFLQILKKTPTFTKYSYLLHNDRIFKQIF